MKVYFHRFELSQIKLNLTYIHSEKLLADLIRNPVSMLPNLDRAPIQLDPVVLHDFVGEVEELQGGSEGPPYVGGEGAAQVIRGEVYLRTRLYGRALVCVFVVGD